LTGVWIIWSGKLIEQEGFMEIEQITHILEMVTSIIGIASVVAALTPTPKDNAVLVKAKQVVDLLAINVLNAENARKPGK
jgi:hypothetical protein